MIQTANKGYRRIPYIFAKIYMSRHFAGMAPRRREPATARNMVQDFLVVLVGLIFLYWIIPYAWGTGDLGLGRSSPPPEAQGDSPPPEAQGELGLASDDERLRKGDTRIVYHDFDLVDTIAGIVGHPRRLLKTRHFTTGRVLSERVTAPVFVNMAWKSLDNGTQNLIDWIYEDVLKLCINAEDGTRHIMDSLGQQRRRCAWNASASQSPANQASAGHRAHQDLRCSTGNAIRRDTLLLSARALMTDIEPACTDTRAALFGISPELRGFREVVMTTMSEMVVELKFLCNVLATLSRADYALEVLPERLLQHLRQDSNVDGMRLESLASRASLSSPGDLDPVTAVLLLFLRGSPLLSEPWDPTRMPAQKWVRQYLNKQINSTNTALKLLVSDILPMAREFPRLIREANDTDVLNDPYSSKVPSMPWSNINLVERNIKGFEDGTDHLEFLIGFLEQLQHGLPGIRTRLDRWNADVAHLADELTIVLSEGKKHTVVRRDQKRSGDDENKLEVKRWQIHPRNLASIEDGLHKLVEELEYAKAREESFNPQDSWQDNWFESQMHKWSRERSVSRAEWEVEQDQKERARMSIWDYLSSLII